jgi:hypothetical protein
MFLSSWLAVKKRLPVTNKGATGCCAWMTAFHNILRETTAFAPSRQAQNASQFKKAVGRQQLSPI